MRATRREFVNAAAASALLAPGEHAKSAPAPWYRRTLVGIEIGPTGANDKDAVYFAKADGQAWIEHLLKARAEYGVLFMKDMEFAYYNSRVARKCPNLGARDLLRECVDAAKPHKLPLVAYCQVQYDDSSWRAHPDWRMKGADGADLGGRLCFNSGYVELIKSVLAEMMAYDIDGFHVDMLDYGFAPPYGCWCRHCRAAFRERYGAEMPPGPTWDEAWERFLDFRCASNTRFCQEVQTFVRSKRPELSVDFNYHGYPPFNWFPGQRPVQHARSGDFVTAEGLPWIFGHNNPSLLALFMAGARSDGAVQAVSSRGVFDYHDFTVRPTAEMTWEVMTYLAHGATFTMVDKLYYDGLQEPLAYERLGEIFGEARAKRELFGHTPMPEVGLYYSCRSRDWWGREDPPKYMSAFWGAHLALVHAHIPMRILLDENLTAQKLSSCPVVYIPGCPILGEHEVALLEAYVRGGGKLVLTGLTGAADRFGAVAARSSCEALVGARLTRCHLDRPDNYLRLPASLPTPLGALGRDVPSGFPLLVYGPTAEFEPRGATAIGSLYGPHRLRNNPWERHMSPESPTGPALLVNELGRGRVVTVPCAIDAAYVGPYRMPEHRKLIRNVVRFLNPEPPVEVRAPLNVEVVVTQDSARSRLLMHLLCFHAPATASAVRFTDGKRVLPPIMEEPERYEATVRLRLPYGAARCATRHGRVARSGGTLKVTTEAIHEVLVVELGSTGRPR